MKRIRTVTALVALCAVIGLAGCSSTAEAPVPEVTETTVAPTVEPTPEPEPAATLEQWASLIAGAKGAVVDAQESWEDNDCLPGDPEPYCWASHSIMGMTAETFGITIDIGTNPDADGYIGDPPPEIANLVTATRDAALTTQEDHDIARQTCPDGNTCMRDASEAMRSYKSLLAQIDAWGPYGVN